MAASLTTIVLLSGEYITIFQSIATQGFPGRNISQFMFEPFVYFLGQIFHI